MDRQLILRRLQRLDWVMVSVVILLMLTGVVFIYSACYRQDDLPVADFYRKQMVWSVFGILAALSLAVFDYRRLFKAAFWMYGVGLFLLVIVLVAGQEINAARRWINVLGIYVQPAEFAKLGVIVALARYLGQPGRNLRTLKTLVGGIAITAVPFLLIVRQPDLGTAAVLIPILLAMLFVSGVPMRRLAVLGLIGLLLMPVGWFALGDYQKERILVFFDPGRDPHGAGWNKTQSQIAVGSGGVAGKGLLKGTQNILGFLPRTVAPTDFIFSVIAEELGFIGGALVLCLFGALCTAGIRTAVRSSDLFGCLLAVGVVAMLFSHVFVNIAMTIGLMPITGLPLPLISYGGSFMVSTMLAIGLMQSIYVRRSRR